MKTLTSMSRFRFDELRRGIRDGSLAKKWEQLDQLPKNSLTKSQHVEFRQISAILEICENSPKKLIEFTINRDWRTLRVVERGGQVYAELVR